MERDSIPWAPLACARPARLSLLLLITNLVHKVRLDGFMRAQQQVTSDQDYDRMGFLQLDISRLLQSRSGMPAFGDG